MPTLLRSWAVADSSDNCCHTARTRRIVSGLWAPLPFRMREIVAMLYDETRFKGGFLARLMR